MRCPLVGGASDRDKGKGPGEDSAQRLEESPGARRSEEGTTPNNRCCIWPQSVEGGGSARCSSVGGEGSVQQPLPHPAAVGRRGRHVWVEEQREREEQRSEKEEEDKEKLRSREEKGKKAIFFVIFDGHTNFTHVTGEIPRIYDGLEQ